MRRKENRADGGELADPCICLQLLGPRRFEHGHTATARYNAIERSSSPGPIDCEKCGVRGRRAGQEAEGEGGISLESVGGPRALAVDH